jgi:MFS-type transporter involved in bile tolerance (Atg22 family)
MIGVVEGFAEVLYDTLLQRLVEPEQIGRAYAFANSAVRTTMLAGTVLAPVVASVAAPHGVILIAGLCLAGAGTMP